MNKKMSSNETNEGIQATTVIADVLAVGRNAKAIKNAAPNEQAFADAVQQLRDAVDALNLQPGPKEQIGEDLNAIKPAAGAEPEERVRAGDALQSVAGKLKALGIIVAEVVSLAEPLRKLADMLRVPLQHLGL